MAKYRRETTPEGIAFYPWLQKPDVKFNQDKGGKYKCWVFIEDKDAKPLIKIIDDTLNEHHLYMEKTEGKKFGLNNVPYVHHGDKIRDPKNNIPKGNVQFKIEQYAMIGGKPYRPIVVDTDGKPMLDANGDNVVVFGGSKVKVSFDLFTYAVGNNLGVSLKLAGVQVIDLQDSAEPDLGKLGFKVEEGYKHSQEDLTLAAEDTSDKKEKESNDFL